MSMNDFVRKHWVGIGGSRLYEPTEPIEIECDLNSGSAPFRCDCRFKLGMVSLGGIVYNEYITVNAVFGKGIMR